MACLSASGAAQPAAPDAGRELIDVASFFNGGFPYTPDQPPNRDRLANQLRTISHGRTINGFYRNDLSKDGSRDAILYYSLAASAMIEAFRVSGEDNDKNMLPGRIELAVSQSPAGNFQTVAAFDVSAPYLAASRTDYDFSMPVDRRIAGRYVRITLSGSKYGNYRLSRFSAYGRFEQPVELREDFSGIYRLHGDRSKANSPADGDMVSQRKGAGHSPLLILHQKGSQISGCYVYATHNGGGGGGIGDGKGLLLKEIGEVLGTVNGGIENNVFRFTRVSAGEDRRSRGAMALGAMALVPVAEGITPDVSTKTAGNLLVMPDARPGGQEGDGAFRVGLTRFSGTPVPCAVAGQKEKAAGEVMAESLAKTGKVQLYGVHFDFDADTLRPESGAVLDEVAELARAHPAWKFEIGGHTDSLGAADYNRKLSQRRAAAVVRSLAGRGIDAARLQARGYGATRPLVPEADGNEAARAQNRRVELVKQ
jgi:outer membrane protein OmpA-like peptidoglycan-associated protein